MGEHFAIRYWMAVEKSENFKKEKWLIQNIFVRWPNAFIVSYMIFYKYYRKGSWTVSISNECIKAKYTIYEWLPLYTQTHKPIWQYKIILITRTNRAQDIQCYTLHYIIFNPGLSILWAKVVISHYNICFSFYLQ